MMNKKAGAAAMGAAITGAGALAVPMAYIKSQMDSPGTGESTLLQKKLIIANLKNALREREHKNKLRKLEEVSDEQGRSVRI
jgi:hypothetical protein